MADNQPANRYKSDCDRAERNSADRDCTDRLRTHGQGTKCNRDAVGAKLTWSAGGVKRTRLKNNGGSYLSSNDLRLHFGLGQATSVNDLKVHWPSGKVETFAAPGVDRILTLNEGTGK